MDNAKIIEEVKKQLQIDFNCTEKDFEYGNLGVTELSDRESDRIMKAVFFGGAAVFSAKEKLMPDLKRIFEGQNPDWIFETKSLIMLAEILYLHGHNMDNIYEYYVPVLPCAKTEPKFDIEIIETGFDRFKNEPVAKEVFDLQSHASASLMAVAKKNGKVVGMAVAFAEKPALWHVEMGIASEERFGCLGENLLGVFKDAVLEHGKIPYYGGASARNISPNTGSAAGFYPCWSQVLSRPRDDEFLNLHGTI